MRYSIDHTTVVKYDGGISGARFNLRLRPVASPGQAVSDFSLEIEPRPSVLEDRRGPFPFHVTRVEIDEPFDTLTIRTRFLADAEEDGLGIHAPDLSIAEVTRAALASSDLGPWSPLNYVFASPILRYTRAIAQWAVPQLPPDAPALESALALARTIQREFRYDGKATEADTSVAEAFVLKAGVCQDFAHVLIVALREVGLPAAYVSGYLRTTPPPGKPRLVGVDAMHAWVALWCGPQRGWVGIDPTNGCLAGTGHIVAAFGRDYSDVSPIDGIFLGGGAQRLETAVDVVPLEE
jgi:transglutaminase-like putative cysteine protease